MRSTLMAAPLLGLAVLLAACGGGAASPSAVPASQAAATPAPASQAPSAAAGGAASLALADNALGKIVTDAKGMSLYVFLPDKAGAPTCYDKCAASWPPLLSDGAPTLGTGLDAEDFKTADRTDGGKQVTFYGWPLYYFAGDKAAGDTKGQGLNDKWYVVGSDGAAIGAAGAASPSASAATTGGGVAVNVATTSLGDVLVDAKGMTLYIFTADADGKSACTGGCAGSWPPLLSDAGVTPGTGLDAEDFGTITRDDGTKQVTFYKMPLYTFGGDKAAGDVNGQGLNGKWYVLKADGTVVK